MRFSMPRRLASLVVGCVATALAACSGNLGSSGVGGGLPAAPGAQGYQQPQGPGASTASTSRQKVTEGAVYATAGMQTIPLPTVGGFSLVLNLTSPAPSSAPSGSGSASPAASASAAAIRSPLQKTSRVVAQVPGPASASGTPAASPSPAPSAAVPSPSASPAAPAPSAASKRASPSPSPSTLKIDTKLVIYPDYAPDAPTPAPTGNVVTYTKRRAIVNGYIAPAADVTLYGLASARFTIPTEEQVPARGFTVAIYSSAKKHKEQLIASDTAALLSENVVASALTFPIVLKKGTGYDIVLYGDDLPSTPAPVASSYATPGTNPFVTPTPSGYPQMPGQPGQQPYPGTTYPPGTATYPPGTATYPPQGVPTFTPYPGH